MRYKALWPRVLAVALCFMCVVVSWVQVYAISGACDLFNTSIPFGSHMVTRPEMWAEVICDRYLIPLSVSGTIGVCLIEWLVRSARKKRYLYVIYVLVWNLFTALMLRIFLAESYRLPHSQV